VFAVVVTGPPGAGKSVVLTALADALIDDQIEHATIDVDEVAWAWPYPETDERIDLLRALWEAHRRAGHELLVVGEVIESSDQLYALLSAVAADDYLLVRLEAPTALLRQRILQREPPGWSGLDQLLAEAEVLAVSQAKLHGVHLVADSARAGPGEIAARIRAARPDQLGG
jgi:broad-specificity NMP kinase